jgi:hypothetical protein
MLFADVLRQHRPPELAHAALAERAHDLSHRVAEVAPLQSLSDRVLGALRVAEEGDAIAAALGLWILVLVTGDQLPRALGIYHDLVADELLEVDPQDGHHVVGLGRRRSVGSWRSVDDKVVEHRPHPQLAGEARTVPNRTDVVGACAAPIGTTIRPASSWEQHVSPSLTEAPPGPKSSLRSSYRVPSGRFVSTTSRALPPLLETSSGKSR